MLSRSRVSVAVQAALSVVAPLSYVIPPVPALHTRQSRRLAFSLAAERLGFLRPAGERNVGPFLRHLATTTHLGCSQGHPGARHCNKGNIVCGSSLPYPSDGAADLAEVAMRRFPLKAKQVSESHE